MTPDSSSKKAPPGQPDAASPPADTSPASAASPREMQTEHLLDTAARATLFPRPQVLVVEDEEAVGRLLEMALRQHGLEVRLARGGREAIDLYRQHHATIALVLLDVQLPDLDGPATLAALREINPGLRCCFMSGDVGDHSAEELLALGAAHVFPKPFPSLNELARALWQTLSS